MINLVRISYFMSKPYSSDTTIIPKQECHNDQEKAGFLNQQKVTYCAPILHTLDEQISFLRGLALPQPPYAAHDGEQEYLFGLFSGRKSVQKGAESSLLDLFFRSEEPLCQLIYSRFPVEDDCYRTILQVRSQPQDRELPSELVKALEENGYQKTDKLDELVHKLRLNLTRLGIGRIIGKKEGGMEILDY